MFSDVADDNAFAAAARSVVDALPGTHYVLDEFNGLVAVSGILALSTGATAGLKERIRDRECERVRARRESQDPPPRISLLDMMSVPSVRTVFAQMFAMVRDSRCSKTFFWRCGGGGHSRDMLTTIAPLERPSGCTPWLLVRAQVLSDTLTLPEFEERARIFASIRDGSNTIVQVCQFCERWIDCVVNSPLEEHPRRAPIIYDDDDDESGIDLSKVDLAKVIAHDVCESCQFSLIGASTTPTDSDRDEAAAACEPGSPDRTQAVTPAPLTIPEVSLNRPAEVLVVDNNFESLNVVGNIVQELLGGSGNVCTANGTEAAFVAMQERSFDLLLVNVEQTKRIHELLARMKEHHADTMVIAFFYNDWHALRTSLDAGAVDYFQIPSPSQIDSRQATETTQSVAAALRKWLQVFGTAPNSD